MFMSDFHCGAVMLSTLALGVMALNVRAFVKHQSAENVSKVYTVDLILTKLSK